MEPLVPSEVARLVFGYLKKEKLDEIADSFLKSSPHLTEYYQMYKTKGSFNSKVNGFNLYDLFDLFGTMCRIINEQISEAHESKTMIERLLYVININSLGSKEDKCVGTVLNVVDKCVGDMTYTDDKSTPTEKSVESNKNANEVHEVPLFSDIVSNNATKINEIDKSNSEINSIIEKNALVISSPSSSLKTQSINYDKSTPTLCNIVDTTTSPKFKLNEQISSTPTKAVYEAKQISQSTLQSSPKIIHDFNQSECQQIPEATSLESMPGLSKDDDPKDGSFVIDASELVDTFLNDKKLLEKFAESINKSFEIQNETDHVQEGKILDPPTLEKALDSTQSDPQIKNVLDEFLVFNVDNCDSDKNISTDDQQNSIKTRLRSAKKSASTKSKKNNIKHNTHDDDEEVRKIDDNIVLISENNVYDSCNLLSNQFISRSTDSNAAEPYNLETFEIDSETEIDYMVKNNFRKIAPKLASAFKTYSVLEKRILPKRKRRNFNEVGVKSQFRKTNINIQPPESVQQSTQSIFIEVPNQNSFETKSNLPEVCKISEVKCINTNETHDTPGDRLKPPKNKSLSTPRRRSTHIRCLDFSTPQPKNNARDQARSKLFCDSPKKIDTIAEESVPSPLPKLQVNWGSVNGFEAIVKKDTLKHWDSEIREMVGAGILTSDADGRKTRKKKTPRKKIKPVNDKTATNTILEKQKESDSLTLINEIQTAEMNIPNVSEIPLDLNNQTFKEPLTSSKSSPKEIPSEFSVSLETQGKITELCNEQPPTKSSALKNFNDKGLTNALETPDKITKLISKQPTVESDPFKSDNDNKLSPKPSIFSIELETPKINICNELPANEFSVSFDTPVKTPEICNKPQITVNPNETQYKHEQSNNSINEQENNLSQSNISTVTNKLTTSCSKTLPEITNKNQEKDSNFLESFNNHKYLKPLQLSTKQTENKSDRPNENDKKQSLDQIEINASSVINSPENKINLKHNLETPFKCDESAVDVPETPISKLIREYDPSKLVTPLPSTPVHYEDSLTETPLTKIFRETSYLNRPPISPFPPTPGNSMSVDTLIVPTPEQECSNFSNQLNGFLDNKTKDIVKQPIQITTNDEFLGEEKKIKPTPLKTKNTVPSKKTVTCKKIVPSKPKCSVNRKSINTNKKHAESVKVELFGSEISSSSSADELEPILQQPKTLVICEKPNKIERKSGFKPIPRKKPILSTSYALSSNEKHLLDETNSQLDKSTTKSAVKQNKGSSLKQTKSTSNITQLKKSKKYMVHFDDPVEQCCVSPIKPMPCNPSNKNVSITENSTVINSKSEHFVGLKAYLGRPLVECKKKSNEKTNKQTKSPKPPVKTSGLNNSSFSAEINDADLSEHKLSNIMTCALSNAPKSYDTTNEENKSSGNCVEDKIKKSNNWKLDKTILNASSCILNNTTVIHEKSYEEHKLTNYCSKDKNIMDESYEKIPKISSSDISTMIKIDTTKSSKSNNRSKNENCLKKKNNDSLKSNQSESTFINYSTINTSLVTVEHDDESFQLIKDSKLVDNAFEIIADDGTSKMLYLSLSDKLTFLDLTSEVNNVKFSSSIILSSSNKVTSIPQLETGELVSSDEGIVEHVTSTPKFILEKKSDDTPKHKDDRYREVENSSVRRRHNYRDSRHDRKHWSNKSWYQDESTHFDRNRFKNNHVKREYDDSIRDSYRFKYRNDKRRSYRDFNRDDDRRVRDRSEEPERSLTGQRMSQKLNKLEVTKKAIKRPAERTDYNKTPAKVSKVEHQRLLKNVNVDDFLSVVHGRK